MDRFLRYQRQILCVILALSAIGFAALYALHSSEAAFGWALGAAAGLVVFRTRALTVARLPELPPEQWGRASLRASLTAYAWVAAPVVAAILFAPFNPYAALAGVLLERVVLRADGWLRPHALADAPGQGEGAPGGSDA